MGKRDSKGGGGPFGRGLEVWPKRGCAEGRSPFSGSLRVSLKYNFFPFLTRKRVEGMIERAFQPGF